MGPERTSQLITESNGIGNSSGNIREMVGRPRPIQQVLGRELKGYQRIAGNVLDSMKISEGDKVDFFEYFIWQERGAGELKEIRDIREYELVSLWDRVLDKEAQRNKYETFYSSYNTVAYFLDLKAPPLNREKAVNNFRSFSLSVAWARQDHSGWTYDDIARELGSSYDRVSEAISVLIKAELINKMENTRAHHREVRDVKDEEAIYNLRINNPEMSQAQIRRKLKLSKGRVGYYISKGIKEGRIKRMRPLPQPKA